MKRHHGEQSVFWRSRQALQSDPVSYQLRQNHNRVVTVFASVFRHSPRLSAGVWLRSNSPRYGLLENGCRNLHGHHNAMLGLYIGVAV
jgi:hypothetical protein